MIFSVFGSMSVRNALVNGSTQIATIWPLALNVMLAHSPPILLNVTFMFLPSGPAHRYVSLIKVSLWMFDFPAGAMKGFTGAGGTSTGLATAGRPVNVGVDAEAAVGSATQSAAAATQAGRRKRDMWVLSGGIKDRERTEDL
jgi:hypothetical protein